MLASRQTAIIQAMSRPYILAILAILSGSFLYALVRQDAQLMAVCQTKVTVTECHLKVYGR